MIIKRISINLLIVLLLLLIPLIAMQYTEEVNWTVTDFMVAGGLLFGTILTIDFAIRKINNKTLRVFIPILLFFVLALIWAELAVGIFGTPFGGS